MVSLIGGKDKVKIRNSTPLEFRNLLISRVQGVHDQVPEMPDGQAELF